MKKTLMLLTLGFVTICLTSCSRGYGCPYTMETKIQKTELKNAVEKERPQIKEIETIETEAIGK